MPSTKMTILRALAACAVLSGPLASCSAAFTPKDKLADSVYPFYDAWRWKKVASLAMHVRPDEREDFASAYEEATHGVLFADYEVMDIKLADDNLKADVSVVFSWYRESDPMVVEAQIIETWERAGKGKPWYRTGQAVIAGEMP